MANSKKLSNNESDREKSKKDQLENTISDEMRERIARRLQRVWNAGLFGPH